MAIHFDFVVSDIDAENIMSALQDEICKHHENILDRMVELGENADYSNDNYIKWYRSRIEYIKELKTKMKNKRSPEHDYLDEQENL